MYGCERRWASVAAAAAAAAGGGGGGKGWCQRRWVEAGGVGWRQSQRVVAKPVAAKAPGCWRRQSPRVVPAPVPGVGGATAKAGCQSHRLHEKLYQSQNYVKGSNVDHQT